MTKGYWTGMDVSLPVGKTFILVIDTDAYSGNFERELCGYATGIWDEDRAHGKREAANALEADEEMVSSIIEKVRRVTHSEYGDVSNTIRRTPSVTKNNGYQSVAVFFTQLLDKDEMEFVRERAKEYAKSRLQQLSIAPFTIKNIYMVEAIVGEVIERRIDGL